MTTTQAYERNWEQERDETSSEETDTRQRNSSNPEVLNMERKHQQNLLDQFVLNLITRKTALCVCV